MCVALEHPSGTNPVFHVFGCHLNATSLYCVLLSTSVLCLLATHKPAWLSDPDTLALRSKDNFRSLGFDFLFLQIHRIIELLALAKPRNCMTGPNYIMHNGHIIVSPVLSLPSVENMFAVWLLVALPILSHEFHLGQVASIYCMISGTFDVPDKSLYLGL